MNNPEIINKCYDKSLTFSKILRKLSINSNVVKKYNLYRHKQIVAKLEPIFQKAYENINYSKKSKESNIIWIFWWQGKDKMPPLSKKCYKSILRNKGKRKIVLITKSNVKQYAILPEYIYTKVENKEISLTHLSDILRFNLLNNYGGLWMDATLYVTGCLDKFSTKKLFTCSGYKDKYLFNISNGKWTGFFIGGPSQLSIFQFMNNFFEEYWKYNDKLIDYFLIDYALNYAWSKNLSDFQIISQKYIDKVPNMFDMQIILNKKYNNRVYLELTKDTIVFKLSYKKKLNKDLNSFYNKVVNNENSK